MLRVQARRAAVIQRRLGELGGWQTVPVRAGSARPRAARSRGERLSLVQEREGVLTGVAGYLDHLIQELTALTLVGTLVLALSGPCRPLAFPYFG